MRTVHILASCRRPELIDMTTLVFKTIRIGFPTTPIYVHLNRMSLQNEVTVRDRAKDINAGIYTPRIGSAQRHDRWLADLIATHSDEFVVCDTDMVFHESVEDWQFDGPMAGALEPRHRNPTTNLDHMERLHTSLLFLKPEKIRDRYHQWSKGLPPVVFPELDDLVLQHIIPGPIPTLFADTAALLGHAVGMEPFTHDQLNAFSHLHCGTWRDVAGLQFPALHNLHMKAVADPQSVRGIWKTFDEWYHDNAA